MARELQPEFLGPAAGSTAPFRYLFPMPKLAIPSTGSGHLYGWRTILMPPPPPGGLAASLAALWAEMSAINGYENVQTGHVLLIISAPVQPTPGCGGCNDYDDWGKQTGWAGPDDPDPMSNFLDRAGVRVALHGGETLAMARYPDAAMYDTLPADAGGWRVMSLTNYHSGCYATDCP